MQSVIQPNREAQSPTTNQLHYKSAIYLALANGAISIFLLFYLATSSYERSSSMIIYVVAALATAFGIWLQSNLIRYIGAGWFLFSTIAIFWPLFSGGSVVWSLAVFAFISIGILSLATAYLLLLSKGFRAEFNANRDNQPPYKRTLKKATVGLLILAATIATIIDIYHLATT